jgi:hypothetical protein
MADTNSFWVDDAAQNAEDLFSPEAMDKLNELNEQSKHDPDLEPVIVEEEPVLKSGNEPDWMPFESGDTYFGKGTEKSEGHPNSMHEIGHPDQEFGSDPNEITVEEEPKAHKDTIPGSDTIFVEEDEAIDKPAKETDWEHDKDPSKFMAHYSKGLTTIPRHSGETVHGCERAIAHLKSYMNDGHQAMKVDLKGVIDELQMDAKTKEYMNAIDRLERQIERLKKKTKKASMDVRLVSEGQCEKCKSNTPMWHDVANNKLVCMHCEAEEVAETDTIEKTAGTARLNVYISAFERAITGIITNSSVSAGHDLEEVYDRLDKQYKFTPREKLAIIQILADMGNPIILDRGRIGDEDKDPSKGGIDYMSNYYA